MRAWRKWLKSQRKHDKDSWAADIGVCRGRAAYARRHRGTNAGQGIPDVVPTVSATPFTARSLVGMTMGARKRAWLSNALYPVVFPSGIITDETEMKAGYSWPEIRSDWPLLGHKLRPCPGCMECDPSGFASICDGSGVLPARRSK